MSDGTHTKSPANPNPDTPLRLEVHRAVLSESRYHNKASLDRIAKHLRTIHASGKLTVQFSQGGIRTVSFEARSTLNGYDHIELKFESK